MSDINVSVTTNPIQITAANDRVIDITVSAVGIQGPKGLDGTGGISASLSGDYYLNSNPNGFVPSGVFIASGIQYQTNLQSTGQTLYSLITGISGQATEIVQVKNFGAIGDNITDDTLAIQAALDYAVSRQNAVVEFDSKTYRLSTYQTPISGGFHTDVPHNLVIQSGNNNLTLKINGNGARLYNNISGVNGCATIGDMLKIRTKCHSINIDSLVFERGPAFICVSMTQESLYHGVLITNVDDSPCKQITFNNCDFINCHRSVSVTSDVYSDYGISSTFGKLEELKFSNCRFLYPYGSNSDHPGGGGQAYYAEYWTLHNYFDNCVFDGLISGLIPNNSQAIDCLDGFIFKGAVNNHITNCSINNFNIEGMYLFPSHLSSYISSPFVQPGVYNTGNVFLDSTIAKNPGYITGDIIRIQDSSQFIGIYQITGISNNQNTLIVYRLPDNSYNTNPFCNNGLGNGAIGLASGDTTPFTFLTVWPQKYEDRYSSTIDNCTFKSVLLNGLHTATSGIGRPNPCICIDDTKAVITNCSFYNFDLGIHLNRGNNGGIPQQQVVISNNNFYNIDKISGDYGYGLYPFSHINLFGNDKIVKNNTFINANSTNSREAIFVQGNGNIIKDNIFIIRKPSPFAWNDSEGSNQSTAAIRISNPPIHGWRNLIKDNFNYGFDYSIAGQNGQNSSSICENFYGKPLIGINNGVAVEEKYDYFYPSGNGWYRIGYAIGRGLLAFSSSIEIGGLKIFVGGSNDGSTFEPVITAINSDYNNALNPPISKVRVLSANLTNFVDVYVNVANYYQIEAYPCRIISRSPHSRFDLDYRTPSIITSFKSGANGPIVTSANHGLSGGGYAFFDNTNCSPVLTGNYLINVINNNTFVISGANFTNIALTSSGTNGIQISRTSNTVTVYTPFTHGLFTGDFITYSGFSNSVYDITGTRVTEITSLTGFSYTKVGNDTGIIPFTGIITIGQFLATSGQREPNINHIKELRLDSKTSFKSTLGIGDIISGGFPTFKPEFFAQRFYDSSNSIWYQANGTNNSSNWIEMGQGNVQSTGSNLSNRLYQTGVTLIGLINAASAGVSSINSASGIISITGAGNVTVISGGLGLIYVSGDTGVYSTFYPFSNPNNYATSGNLQNTGINLQSSLNLVSGNLTSSGQTLNTKINTLSGYTNTIFKVTGLSFTGSAGLTGLINFTGQNIYFQVSGNTVFLSGASDVSSVVTNLQSTGSTLYSYIIGSSGVISNNLYQTGSALFSLINNSIPVANQVLFGNSPINSGNFSTGFVLFPQNFTTTPTVISDLINNSGDPLLSHYISGISNSGFFIHFSDIIATNNYRISYLATTGTGLFSIGMAGGSTTISGGVSGQYLRKYGSSDSSYEWSNVLVGVASSGVTIPSFVPNTNAGNTIDLILTGIITLSAPTGYTSDGQTLTFRFLQNSGATGIPIITWNSIYSFGTDITTGMMPTGAGSKFEVGCKFHKQDNKWRIVGLARGF